MPQPARSTSRNAALVLAAAVVAWTGGASAGSVVAVSTATPASAAASATPHGPQILSLSATPEIVHGGQSVLWDVRTTADVVSVDARVALYALQLHKRSPGHFVLTFAVPNGLPWFFHRVYDLDVRAHSGSGEIVHRSIRIDFR